jgi:hypothetical protein
MTHYSTLPALHPDLRLRNHVTERLNRHSNEIRWAVKRLFSVRADMLRTLANGQKATGRRRAIWNGGYPICLDGFPLQQEDLESCAKNERANKVITQWVTDVVDDYEDVITELI